MTSGDVLPIAFKYLLAILFISISPRHLVVTGMEERQGIGAFRGSYSWGGKTYISKTTGKVGQN